MLSWWMQKSTRDNLPGKIKIKLFLYWMFTKFGIFSKFGKEMSFSSQPHYFKSLGKVLSQIRILTIQFLSLENMKYFKAYSTITSSRRSKISFCFSSLAMSFFLSSSSSTSIGWRYQLYNLLNCKILTIITATEVFDLTSFSFLIYSSNICSRAVRLISLL